MRAKQSYDSVCSYVPETLWHSIGKRALRMEFDCTILMAVVDIVIVIVVLMVILKSATYTKLCNFLSG